MNTEPQLIPARAVFNFLTRCNMSCRFCYLRFGEPPSALPEWQRIVDRIADLGIGSITFGGGDPFAYADFPELLLYAKEVAGFQFVQVDTNGLRVLPKHYPAIASACNLLGLPLDGSSREVHGTLRGNPRHHGKVLHLLRDLGERGQALKVNTVVCQENIGDLEQLAGIIKGFRVRLWSLYEFWGIGPAQGRAAELSISAGALARAVRRIAPRAAPTAVEVGSVEGRKHAYFFVSNSGRAYTIKREDCSKYAEIGSVFDEDVLANWAAQNPVTFDSRLERRRASLC